MSIIWLFVNAETAEWFRERRVKAVGFGDGVSIENRNEDVKPFHDILLAENIIFRVSGGFSLSL